MLPEIQSTELNKSPSNIEAAALAEQINESMEKVRKQLTPLDRVNGVGLFSPRSNTGVSTNPASRGRGSSELAVSQNRL